MTGLTDLATPRTLVAILAALAAVLVVIGVIVTLVHPGGGPGERVVTGASTSAPEPSTASPRMSRIAPPAAEPLVTGMLEVSGPACDAPVINADLHHPRSRARIIDCQAGWAVMASGVTGNPYWVAYSHGRWRRVGGVPMSPGTCPEVAIDRGAPVWMAQKHLGDCGSGEWRAPTTSTATAPSRTSSESPSIVSTTPRTLAPMRATTPSAPTSPAVPTFVPTIVPTVVAPLAPAPAPPLPPPPAPVDMPTDAPVDTPTDTPPPSPTDTPPPSPTDPTPSSEEPTSTPTGDDGAAE